MSTPTPTTSTPGTPEIHRAYLPVGLRLHCGRRPVDVVLMIDASTSMLREAVDLGTKQDAVMRAARGFVEGLAPETTGSRVAVAAFNARAWVIEPLTGDSVRLRAALDRLPLQVAEGTRLDLALEVGADAVGEPVPGRWRAMVLLTDGMPNWVPTPTGGGTQDETVLAAAARVRARGIVVHTVGYGRADAVDPADRISPTLLRGIAGSRANYHETDDGFALTALFIRIAEALGCPREGAWP